MMKWLHLMEDPYSPKTYEDRTSRVSLVSWRGNANWPVYARSSEATTTNLEGQDDNSGITHSHKLLENLIPHSPKVLLSNSSLPTRPLSDLM